MGAKGGRKGANLYLREPTAYFGRSLELDTASSQPGGGYKLYRIDNANPKLAAEHEHNVMLYILLDKQRQVVELRHALFE